jgi:hypothetical protein
LFELAAVLDAILNSVKCSKVHCGITQILSLGILSFHWYQEQTYRQHFKVSLVSTVLVAEFLMTDTKQNGEQYEPDAMK